MRKLTACPECGSDVFLLQKLKRKHLRRLACLTWPVECSCCGTHLIGPALPIVGYLVKDALPHLPTIRVKLHFPFGHELCHHDSEAATVVQQGAQAARQEPPSHWLWQVSR